MWMEDEQLPYAALFWNWRTGHAQMLLFYVHTELNYGGDVSLKYYKTLQHEYSTRGPWAACCTPGCITRPAAASTRAGW